VDDYIVTGGDTQGV
jgi:Reverse transcriptase (RNA-dependent DNA polymerase)